MHDILLELFHALYVYDGDDCRDS